MQRREKIKGRIHSAKPIKDRAEPSAGMRAWEGKAQREKQKAKTGNKNGGDDPPGKDPQVEFIARVLRNREGQPWIMRRRTTAEIDELVRVSGFRKMAMEVDQWGMFTVSIARRAEP